VFFILVVAADPSYFNFFQPIALTFPFWHQRLLGIAGWLWRNPQADAP
jgi:hypothetical protein